VEDLGHFHASLARALSEAGLGGPRLNEIFSTCLRVECARCAMQITNDEIEQMSLSEDSRQPLQPKLQRLRLGYCARGGCESYFYAVHMENHPDVDWEAIAEKAGNLLAATKPTAGKKERRQPIRKRHQQTMRFAAGLLIIAVLLLSWFVARHGRLPLTTKKHKYEIDPASVSRPPWR